MRLVHAKHVLQTQHAIGHGECGGHHDDEQHKERGNQDAVGFFETFLDTPDEHQYPKYHRNEMQAYRHIAPAMDAGPELVHILRIVSQSLGDRSIKEARQ